MMGITYYLVSKNLELLGLSLEVVSGFVCGNFYSRNLVCLFTVDLNHGMIAFLGLFVCFPVDVQASKLI